MKRSHFMALFVVGSLLAVLYIFLPPKLVIGMGLGILRHNDRVMVGTLGLIVAFVSGYALVQKKPEVSLYTPIPLKPFKRGQK